MNGWLIYDESGAARNHWFIDQLIMAAREMKIELNAMLTLENWQHKLNSIKSEFAIVRTRNPIINKFLEKNGIRAFNNYCTSLVANDKWKTFQLAKKLSIPTMPTVLLDKGFSPTKYPLIIKSRDGHGGREVFLITSPGEYKDAINHINVKNYIAQEVCTRIGIDMRLYILGDKVIAAILRRSLTDFRSNFSLGGKADIAQPTAEQIEIAKALVGILDSDFIGIDFISHNGAWVLNEIEDVVGTRMLYKCTDINAAQCYIDYIYDEIGKK